MSVWQRLFGSRKITPPEPQPRPAAQRPAASTKPETPLPGSPEAWAQDLKARKDYSGLIGAITEKTEREKWPYPRAAEATKTLKEAGSEAVDAILQSIASRQYCDIDLAELLVEIGEPRAATALKPYLLKRQFSWQPGTESNIQRFISKCDKGFQAELDALHATEEAVADARLTAPPAPGTQLREYATAYVFRPAAEARRAFDALETGIRGRNGFPLDAPYQVALVHGPAADFVAVLVRLPTANDESVALHRRVEAWFAQVGVGRPDDYESLSAPLPGRLSRGLRYLASEYTVLAMIDKL